MTFRINGNAFDDQPAPVAIRLVRLPDREHDVGEPERDRRQLSGRHPAPS